MKNKLEVGMYVRTNEGIKKIEDYNYHKELPDNHLDFNKHHIYKQDIIKSSNNIIDLIEVGDYVNGYLIDYIDSERRYLRSERPYREDSTMYKDLIEKGRNYNQCLHFFAEDIKSIVTKEKLKSVEYEV